MASQKIALFVYDSTTGAPKTGDGANLTPYVSKDYGTVTVLGTTTATEMDSTNAKGWYSFVLTQGETNADALLFSGKSSTANAYVVGSLIYTDPPSYTSFVTPTNLTAAQIATGVWQDTTSGDFTTALSVGKSVMNGVSLGTGLTVASVSGAVGSVTGAVGSVTGAVGSVTGNVGGNVVGSVASVAGAVGSVTGLTASNLDATISSRLASGSYTAPDNTSVAAIKVQTDKMTFTVANQMDSNVLSINGDATSAANLAKTTKVIGRGTVSGSPSTTSIPTSAMTPAGAAADQFKGRIITFDASTTTTALRGQATDITASSNAAAPTFTVTALTTAPSSGDTFSIT